MSKKKCLRKKSRINYHEEREPDFDEYVFCDLCNDYVYEYCCLHGPLLVIPDDEVPIPTNIQKCVPHAALTIPKEFLHLAPSIIPGAGIGVFSSVTLPRGIRFGPYRGQCTFEVNSSYCWQIYNAKHKPLHVVDALDGAKSNWMRYVNCSRHVSEQNLVAFQFKGELYYRTIKTIPRFTELLIYYGSQFATALNINVPLYNSQSIVCAIKFDQPLPKLHKINNDFELFNKVTSKKYPIPALRKIPKVYELHEDLEGNNYANGFENETNIDHDEYCTDDKTISSSNTHTTDEVEPISSRANVNNNILVENVDWNNIFICNFCNDSFRSKTDIIEHLERHASFPDPKYFECKDCQYKTVHVNQFQIHVNFHDKNRRSQCKFCGYRFNSNYSLKHHVAKHFRLKNVEKNHNLCSLCPYTGATQAKVNKHNSRVHKISQVNKLCALCKFKTSSEYNFNRHMSKHLNLIITCNACGKTMSRGSLRRHMKLVHKEFS